MSGRLAQVIPLHQLRASSSNSHTLQQLVEQLATAIVSCQSDCSAHPLSQPKQQMTTGQPLLPLQVMKGKQQAAAVHDSQTTPAAAWSPSPSTSISECRTSDRCHTACASTKSAKRKAAEALLAARYSSSSIPSITAASPAGAVSTVSSKRGALLPAAALASFSVEQAPSKRHKSTLSAAIDKLQGTSNHDATAAASPAVCTARVSHVMPHRRSRATTQQQTHPLEKLQLALERLQENHQQHKHESHEVVLPQKHTSNQPSGQQQSVVRHDKDTMQDQQQQQAGQQAAVSEQQQSQLQQLHPSSAAVPSAASLRQLPHRHVQACDTACSHRFEHGWCHTEVKLPHVDWARVLDADLTGTPSFKVAKGYERLQMPEGLQVLIVENPLQVPNALQQLRASMQDPLVAIDLEWRPEFGRRFTPVALMQLATSRTALLIRTCKMNYRLPQSLKDFLKDPKIHLVGFSWGSSDEPKMQSTFGVGIKDFGRFHDLQQVAQGLGYCGFGLARLTKRVLGLNMPKSKKVSMSNWEAAVMNRNQVKYAALDVLVAGQVFRALRLWHSSPSMCEVCHYYLGSASSSVAAYACSCGKSYKDIKAYLTHCERAKHEAMYAECSGCGCTRSLPWPSSTSSGSSSDSPDGSSSGGGSQVLGPTAARESNADSAAQSVH